MNMAISSTPVSTGKTASASTGTATGSVSGSGFAGALVQAIDGSGNAAAASSGLSLPVGLAGLLGQLGLDASGEQSQDLLKMLASLIEQLQQLEQSGTEAVSPEVEDQLAALLASFQGLLQQINQVQVTVPGEQTEALDSELTAVLVQNSAPKPVVQALRETLQLLSKAIDSGKDGIQLASNFAGQLKALLDSLEPKTSNVIQSNTSAVDADSSTNAQPPAKAASLTVDANAVPKEAMSQTAAVVQEPRRPVQALRDPVWRFNVIGGNEASATNGQTAAVAPVAITEEANQSGSQPAWTFMQNDTLTNTESTTGKAAVPTQVPVQQFAAQMEKFLVKQFQLTQGNGTSEAKLTLTPEHLGQVDIRIVMQNGQLTAQFMTDNPMARDLLENQMTQLRTALSGQGLQVDRLEVVQQPPSSTGTSFMQQEHRQSNSGNGNGSNGNGKGDSLEDPAVFAAELERNSSLKEFGFGSSINVTA